MIERRDPHPRELISAWLDGEVRAAERTVVEEHLAACASCRSLVEDLKALARATSDEEPAPVPHDLASRISWRLRSVGADAGRGGLRGRWRATIPLTAAATIGAIALLVLALRQGVERPGDVVSEVGAPKQEASRADASGPANHDATPISPSIGGWDRREPVAAPPAKTFAPSPAWAGQGKEEQRKKEIDRLALASRANTEAKADLGREKAQASLSENDTMASAITRSKDETARREEHAEAAAPSPAESSDRFALAPGIQDSKERARDAETPSNQPRSQRASASSGFAKSMAAATCLNAWAYPASPVVWSVASPADEERTIESLVRGVSGSAAKASGEPSTYRIEVPRESWPEFLSRLRRLGVSGLDQEAPPPSGADCVRLSLRLEGKTEP